MDLKDINCDIKQVIVTEKQIKLRVKELALKIDYDYKGQDLLIVGILKGAVMIMADLARAMHKHVFMDWMAVSSYESSTLSSGVVRILKDLDVDIYGKNVLIVEDILDTGLTLSWLKGNLLSRKPKSVEICTLFRKPEVAKINIDVRYIGFDIPKDFVVGYGLDYAEKYRNLNFLGTLSPHVYKHKK